MKKVRILICCIVLLIAMVLGGVAINITQSPQYTLKKVMEDVNASGIDGLSPHLTENAQEKVDQVVALANNPLVGAVMGLLNQDDNISVLVSEIQNVKWTVKDVLKGKQSSNVVLGFDYEEKLIGTVEIIMKKVDHEWKIDGIGVPSFDEVKW